VVGRIWRAVRRSEYYKRSHHEHQPLWWHRAAARWHAVLQPAPHSRSAYRAGNIDRGCRQIRSGSNQGCGSIAGSTEERTHDDRQSAGRAHAGQFVGQRKGGASFDDSQYCIAAFRGQAEYGTSAIVRAADGAPTAVHAAESLLAGGGRRTLDRRKRDGIPKHADRGFREAECWFSECRFAELWIAGLWKGNEYWCGAERGESIRCESRCKSRRFASVRSTEQQQYALGERSAAPSGAAVIFILREPSGAGAAQPQ